LNVSLFEPANPWRKTRADGIGVGEGATFGRQRPWRAPFTSRQRLVSVFDRDS
jgi:hypothetical protein